MHILAARIGYRAIKWGLMSTAHHFGLLQGALGSFLCGGIAYWIVGKVMHFKHQKKE